MKACTRLDAGTVELYFYDELDAAERAAMAQHIASCVECRQGIAELEMIRTALLTRPDVTAPPGDDWSGFMTRLQRAVASAPPTAPVAGNGKDSAPVRVAAIDDYATESRTRARRTVSFRATPSLAIAATLVLAATSLVYVARSGWAGHRGSGTAPGTAHAVPASAPVAVSSGSADPAASTPAETAFAVLSEQHFERSKLVVIGLANKDARRVTREDWEYERQLASSLLTDTRLYRQAAEERGMKRIADVMGDLELVLLQTSLGAQSSSEDLEQIQRLIDRRDLVTKMAMASGT